MGKKCIVRNRKCKNPKCALKIINTHEKYALNQKIRDRERLILEEKERG